jgi:hypothetical protein
MRLLFGRIYVSVFKWNYLDPMMFCRVVEYYISLPLECLDVIDFMVLNSRKPSVTKDSLESRGHG